MLPTRGLLWVGTSVGCVLTLSLPRLEGVPQLKGRPSVSYQAHCGPVRFLLPIYCGKHIVNISGEPDAWSDTESLDHNVTVDSTTNLSEISDGILDNALEKPSNLMQKRWANSTPDLRFVGGEPENVRDIYKTLLHPSEKMYEKVILGKNAEKHQSGLKRALTESKTHKKLRHSILRTQSKEDSGTNVVGDKLSSDETSPDNLCSPATCDYNTSPVIRQPSGLAVAGKDRQSLIVVSGGEGHISWQKGSNGQSFHKDMCLLMWQSVN